MSGRQRHLAAATPFASIQAREEADVEDDGGQGPLLVGGAETGQGLLDLDFSDLPLDTVNEDLNGSLGEGSVGDGSLEYR